MTGSEKIRISLVDDDPCILATAKTMLENVGYECQTFLSAESCLAQFNPRSCDLLVTDVQMPGISGLELLSRTKKAAPWIPIIVITSYADIAMAVQAVKNGAFDFVEKPLEVDKFIELVDLALKHNKLDDSTVGKPLTKTEKIVLKLIIDGMSNRGIAYTLHRSERTVEVHRSHIMRKLNVDNVVDLVKRVASLSFDETEQ